MSRRKPSQRMVARTWARRSAPGATFPLQASVSSRGASETVEVQLGEGEWTTVVGGRGTNELSHEEWDRERTTDHRVPTFRQPGNPRGTQRRCASSLRMICLYRGSRKRWDDRG